MKYTVKEFSDKVRSIIGDGTVTGTPAVSAVFNDDGGKSISIRLGQPQAKTATDVNGINRVFLNGVQSGATFNNFQFYLQVESGTTATEVVPYSEADYPLNLSDIELCKLGTYQDYIWKDGDEWKIHKATNRAKLGVLDWGNYQNVAIYADHISEVFGIVNLGNPTLAFVSNIFKASNDSSFTWRCYYNGQNDHLNTYGDSAYNNMSGSDAKQWLTDNNAELLYALATPTDTIITDTNLITQLEAIRTASLENGANIITNTATGTNLAGDMEIGYFGYNPTNRYDKFIWLDLNNNYEQIGGE